MLIIHPTYRVQFAAISRDNIKTSGTLRVSEPDLEGFLRVLTFNGVQKFDVVKEEDGTTRDFQSTVS